MGNKKYFSSLADRLKPNPIRRLSTLINRPGIISFAGGVPSPETFPYNEIAEISSRLVYERGGEVLQYGVTRGNRQLIEYLVQEMQNRKVETKAEEFILTSGSQQGLDLVSRLLIDPGDVVLVELPSYIGGTYALNNAGAELVGIEMAMDGLEPSIVKEKVLELRKQGRKVKLIYTIPNFQNPSGITLSLQKRKDLLALASELDLLILEDDPYGELYFSAPPPPPIKSFDKEGRVIYLGSFSKVLTPGLRTAWIVANSEFVANIELIKESADLCSSMLDQAIVAECGRQGLINKRLGVLREFYQIRCQSMLQALKENAPANTVWTQPTGGLFVWVELANQEIDTTKLLTQAVETGVAYVPGQPFYVNEGKANSLRLAFSKETPERISQGIKTLCSLL
ncbi:MAG: PLP-dependent aminotransferase family protein [Acidobacteria bacterium]|nr:PLP-dependent aminotransferase family protein [Acidobacteriota bacterium]